MDISVRDKGLYAFGSFRLDPARRVLTCDGSLVALTPKLFDALLFMVENPTRLLTKDELLDALWPGRVVEESNLTQTVFALRKALGVCPDSARFIVTVPGRGYRFPGPVGLELWESRPTALASVTPPLPAAPRPARSGAAAIGAGLVVLAGLATAFWLWSRVHPPVPPATIVLADFENLTGDGLFDRALGKALEIDLVQSPFIAVLPGQEVEETLGLMTRATDERLTPALAREVCSRRNGRAVIGGSIAALGTQYLLTLTATNCTDGTVLAAEKAEVQSREGLIGSLDRLAADIRGGLGESPDSIRRFDAPLLPEKTASLEALKAYSEAVSIYNHGKRAEAIPLLEHAVDLDPNFAAAYATLSGAYLSLHDSTAATKATAQAYDLRATVSTRERVVIEYRYDRTYSRDLDAAIRLCELWTQSYPSDWQAWSNLSDTENWLGHFAEAVAAGRQAFALAPDAESPYVVLARALMHSNQFDAAQDISMKAVTKGVAGDNTHGLLLEIALARGDRVAAEREMDWAKGKPAERMLLIHWGLAAYNEGRIRDGDAAFARVDQIGRSLGLAPITAAPTARLLTDLGLPGRAKEFLAAVPERSDSADYHFAMAEIGDAERAQTLIEEAVATSPSDTLLNNVVAPEVRAALALRRGRPQQAITALERSAPYELRVLDTLYLRATAYLAAGDGARAATAFRRVIDHRGVDPATPLNSLSLLGLARAEQMTGNVSASRRAYEALFSDWRNADSDLPPLIAARMEYARLQTIH